MSLSIPPAIELFVALLTSWLRCLHSLWFFPVAGIRSASLVFVIELVRTFCLSQESLLMVSPEKTTQLLPNTSRNRKFHIFKAVGVIVGLQVLLSIRKLCVTFNQNFCPNICSSSFINLIIKHSSAYLCAINAALYVFFILFSKQQVWILFSPFDRWGNSFSEIDEWYPDTSSNAVKLGFQASSNSKLCALAITLCYLPLRK